METSAAAKGIVGEVENMIRFMVRHVNYEQWESLIDGIDETKASGEKMKGANAAMADAMHAVSDLVVDVAGGQHGPSAVDTFGFIEPTLHPALASAETLSYFEKLEIPWRFCGVE